MMRVHRSSGCLLAIALGVVALDASAQGDPAAVAAHDLYRSKQIPCAACHTCGKKAYHPVAWMDPASAGFHAFSANGGVATCKGCHGDQLDGSGATATTTVSCAACHGALWATSCTMCHGGQDNLTGAPPVAIWGYAGDPNRGGGTADPVRAGTHTSHIAATHALAPAVGCAACHLVPADALAAAHLDGTTATVTFGGLASQGTTPSWTRSSATCASTYCHGATLAGGQQTSPVWTLADGTQRACTSCHGNPPPAPHPQKASCGDCHAGYTQTTVNAATHVDGRIDVSVTCTSCHGKAGQPASAASPLDAAPPVDTAGASTGVHVGAHQKHLLGGTYSGGMACATCHALVGGYGLGHANGVSDVGFGGAANVNLRKGAWRPGTGTAAGTCASTWCHGAVIGRNGGSAGGTMLTPSWTGTITSCTACHGAPPSTGKHTSESDHRVACGYCHGGTYTQTTVDKTRHVNGAIEVNGSRIRTWDPATHRCYPTCHGSETW